GLSILRKETRRQPPTRQPPGECAAWIRTPHTLAEGALKVKPMKYAALPATLMLLAGLVSFLEVSRADPVPEKIDFNRQIRPILSNNCFQCHGPEDKKRRADLRLDTKQGAFADLGGHHAIVPGNVARSKLIERITSTDKSHVMPPPSTGKTLKAEEVQLL